MAISSIRFDNFQNINRQVDVSETNTIKQRVSVISGERATREATLTVGTDGAASRTVSLEGKNFSRQVSSSTDGQGNASRSVSLTLPNGQQVTRDTSISKTVDEAGNTKVAVNRTVNGLAGVRTFVGDITSTDVTGTFTYAKGDATQTYAVEYERKRSNIEPPPLPIQSLPVEPPLDELA